MLDWGVGSVSDEARSDPQQAAVHWLRAARAGDRRAFQRFVESYMRAVYAIGYRLLGNHDDADDIAQETFVRAWQALERYDERYSPYTWVRTIATRLAVNELAKRRRRQTEGGERFEVAAETHASNAAHPDDEVEAHEARERLERALQALPAEYRAALVLRVHEELAYDDIARALEIPVGTVMSRIHRARRMLRRFLEESEAPVRQTDEEESAS